jgi:hypothetical protein
MDIESYEKVLFTIQGYEFDGIAVIIIGAILMGLIVGSMTLTIAVKSKSSATFNRVFMGSLGSILLSCTGLIGMAFF